MNQELTAAFFDIDHTLTRHSTAIRCIMYNLNRRLIPFSFLISIVRPYFQYKRGKMNLANCHTMMSGVEGIERAVLDEMGLLSFEKYSGRDLFPEMEKLIRSLRAQGIPVILATSSPRFVVEPYFRYLRADHLICTELDFNDTGKTSGSFAGPVAFDEGKKLLVASYMEEKDYDPLRCAFYSDSIHDLPTLSMVGKPVAVNPDRKLKKEALSRNWEIILP